MKISSILIVLLFSVALVKSSYAAENSLFHDTDSVNYSIRQGTPNQAENSYKFHVSNINKNPLTIESRIKYRGDDYNVYSDGKILGSQVILPGNTGEVRVEPGDEEAILEILANDNIIGSYLIPSSTQVASKSMAFTFALQKDSGITEIVSFTNTKDEECQYTDLSGFCMPDGKSYSFDGVSKQENKDRFDLNWSIQKKKSEDVASWLKYQYPDCEVVGNHSPTCTHPSKLFMGTRGTLSIEYNGEQYESEEKIGIGVGPDPGYIVPRWVMGCHNAQHDQNPDTHCRYLGCPFTNQATGETKYFYFLFTSSYKKNCTRVYSSPPPLGKNCYIGNIFDTC
ncbi:MAG: hypothetical protein AAGA27_08225 [Pseudomonadota bacterium]